MQRAWVEVELAAMRANVAAIRQNLGAEVGLMAVVKADAYGHGLVPAALAAAEAGAAWLGVAAVAEGARLREAGIAAPILLLCAPAPEEAAELLAHRIAATVGDGFTLESLERAARAVAGPPPEVHLEIETGMGRAGALPEQAVALWRRAQAAGFGVTGLCTHFADAENPDGALNAAQRAAFAQARASLEQAGARFRWIHLSNSAAALRFPAGEGNLVRPGLLLYGIVPPMPELPEQNLRGLRPALALKARVATVRSLPAGHAISYGATCRLTRPGRVATVLIGYGDGYPRRLSNCGHMLLHGRRAPILGRICMDQTVVDVTEIPEAAPGDVAVCIGMQGAERIAVEEIAARIETTEHEITTCLTSRLPRLYPSS